MQQQECPPRCSRLAAMLHPRLSACLLLYRQGRGRDASAVQGSGLELAPPKPVRQQALLAPPPA